MIKVCIVFITLLLVVSFSVSAEKPENSVYIDGGENQSALILAHGKGKHPTWLVVNPLRKGVNDQLGFHTLSLQMPTGHQNWKDYAGDFPKAYITINRAIRFLRDEKGVTKIFLMGHSMGSRMTSSFVSKYSDQLLSGLIIVGCRNNGGSSLSCTKNLRGIDIPVLDLWGGRNQKDANAASERRGLVSERYTQVEVAGANHRLEGFESELVSITVDWLMNKLSAK